MAPAPQSEDWTCTVCLDNFPASEKHCKIPCDTNSHYRACAPCLKTQFFRAMENELNYPVKWQTQTLHPRQFPSVFNRTFVRAYDAKEVEYNAPALQRVYCECGTFVAPMVGEDARASWVTLASSRLCPRCEARWCLRCAQRCGGFGVEHDCVPERRLGERRLALGGLKKGKDYQICPYEGCGRTIELAEACNAINCPCGTNFCYVCGVQAGPESEHWLRAEGGCPRYGVAGSARLIYDDDFSPADEDTENLEFWQRGEGESTTFDFNRWEWQAAMAEGMNYDMMLTVLDGVSAIGDFLINPVRRAMEMYNPVSRSGVSEQEWYDLVGEQVDSVKEWLETLYFSVRFGHEDAHDVLGGKLLDIQPRHVFNISIAEDREAAAVWVRQASVAATDWYRDNDVEWPGSAVFDVGPGGASGESWRIRDMEMFEDVPALGLFKLAGGALLAVPKPQQQQVAVQGELFSPPDSEATTESEEATADDEIAKEASAGDDTAQDESAGDETAEEKSTELDIHDRVVDVRRILVAEQTKQTHRDFMIRLIAVLVCCILVESCLIDWRTFARGQ